MQPLGSCASEPCDGCACLYLRLDAEGTFSNTEQTTETTTYPPPFLRVKIHFFLTPNALLAVSLQFQKIPLLETAGIV